MLTKRILFLAAFTMICLGVFAGAQAKSDDITFTTKSDQARTYFMQGLENNEYFLFPQAIDNFQKAIKEDPKFAMAYYYLSMLSPTAAEQNEMLNKAVEYSANASKPEQLIIQSAVDMRDDKIGMAKDDLQQLVKLVPQGKRAHSTLGMFYFMQNDWKPAQSEFQKVVEIDQTYAPAYNNLAYLYSDQGNYADAIKALQKYAELRPKDANPHDSMGEIYLWMGDYTNSLKEYNNSLAMDPNFTPSLAGIGHNNVFQEKFDDARNSYDQILIHAANVGDTNMAYQWKAISYLHENKPDQAIQTMNDAAEFARTRHQDGNEAEIQGNVAAIYLWQGDLSNAILNAGKEEKLAQSPNIEVAMRAELIRDANAVEAIANARQGNNDKAKSLCESVKSSAEKSNNPMVMHRYNTLTGVVAYWEKDYPTAIADLKMAGPDDQMAKFYTALSLDATGKADQAHPLYEEIAKYNHNGLEYGLVRPQALEKIQMKAGY